MVSRYSKLPSPRACLLADWTAELVPPGTALAGLWPEWSGISALCSRMVLATVLVWGTFECMIQLHRASSSDPASSLAPQSQAARGASLVAQARAVLRCSLDSVRFLSACPSVRLASFPGHMYLVLARSALFSLDSLASADLTPPGCLVASRVTRPDVPRTRTVARTIREHRAEIPDYFDHRPANAVLEGTSSAVQSAKRQARGLDNLEYLETIIYPRLGKLRFPRRPSVLPTKNREEPELY